MKITTWNVNSVRARITNILNYLKSSNPDILMIQEIKTEEKNFPFNDLKHENIVIDKSSLGMLKGSQVDFSQELIGDSFKISNPKTKSSCGCGISFSF